MTSRATIVRTGKSRDRDVERMPTRPRRNGIRVGTASWTDPGFIEGWSKQTPGHFVFDIKLHRLLSRHSTPPKLLPRDFRPLAKVHKDRVELTPRLEAAMVKRFLEGIEPLREAGKLGALLLQLSPSFSPRSHTLEELDNLIGLTRGYRLAVELRHREWLIGEKEAETIAYFKKRRVTLVSVDGPRSEHFMVLPAVDVVTNPRLAYLRAHGRNARGYISGCTVGVRFDYDYPAKELREIADRAADLAEVAGTTHIIFNNNKSSYAPKAAQRFRRMVETKVPASVGP
jgi:uncharacterized protein YecE (DUF72 family)